MANNEESETIDGTTWSYEVSNGEATITKCLRYKRQFILDIPEPGTDNIAVPSRLGGCPVRYIGDKAFADCRELRSVKMPDRVVSIGKKAFSGCIGLESVKLPSSLTSIGSGAFAFCKRLKGVKIPRRVKSIGDDAFSDCSELKSITIPDSVTNIGRDAFSGCIGLKRIKIPRGVTHVGSGAFSHCDSLIDTTTIPGVMLVDGWVIGHTPMLPSKVNLVGIRGIGDGAFSGCSGLTSVTMPDGVTSIGWDAFSGCSGLTSIAIPEGVTIIGGSAFSRCTGLTSIAISGKVRDIENFAFSSCTGLVSVKISAPVTSIGYGAFSNCSGLKNITMPDSVTSIGRGAFRHCSGLTNVTMPAGMTSIDRSVDDIFDHCEALASITIPSSVTSIEPLAFAPRPRQVSFVVDSGNPKYKSVNGLVLTKDGKTLVLGINGNVTIPDGVESIGKEAFRRCKGLVAVKIPDSTTSIDDTAFANCDNLTSIVVSGGNSAYSSANGLLLSKDGKTLLTGVNGDIAIPHGVATICGMAFCNRKGLRRVTIPDSVTNIEDGAFFGCSQLTKVEIPAGTANMSIGVNSFDGCDLLAEVPRVGGAFPGDPCDPVRKEWERKVDAISGECRSLLTSRGRDGVKTIVKRAFSIIPDEWSISNERDAGRYFRLFCNRVGWISSLDNDPLKDAQVEFGSGDAYLFEFTCGKSSYHALAARESHGVGIYWNWERAHLFGVNYNPDTRSIDAPYSTSYAQRRIPRTCRGPMDGERALCRVGLDEYGKDDDIGPMNEAIKRFESRTGKSLEREKNENERKKLEEERRKRGTEKSHANGKTGGMMSIDESLEMLRAICEINENRSRHGTRPKGRVELSDGEKFAAILTIMLGVSSWIYFLGESIVSGKVFDIVIITIILLMIAFFVYMLRRISK